MILPGPQRTAADPPITPHTSIHDAVARVHQFDIDDGATPECCHRRT